MAEEKVGALLKRQEQELRQNLDPVIVLRNFSHVMENLHDVSGILPVGRRDELDGKDRSGIPEATVLEFARKVKEDPTYLRRLLDTIAASRGHAKPLDKEPEPMVSTSRGSDGRT